MTVIVQQSTDSNGNPQPMVYDQDTGKVIVDSNGYVLNGGQRLVNVPSIADYVSTPKTQTAGIQEAYNWLPTITLYETSVGAAVPCKIGTIVFTGNFYEIHAPIIFNAQDYIKLESHARGSISVGNSSTPNSPSSRTIIQSDSKQGCLVIQPTSDYTSSMYGLGYFSSSGIGFVQTVQITDPVVSGQPYVVMLGATTTNMCYIDIPDISVLDLSGLNGCLSSQSNDLEAWYKFGAIQIGGTTNINAPVVKFVQNHLYLTYIQLGAAGSSSPNTNSIALYLDVVQDINIGTLHFYISPNSGLYAEQATPVNIGYLNIEVSEPSAFGIAADVWIHNNGIVNVGSLTVNGGWNPLYSFVDNPQYWFIKGLNRTAIGTGAIAYFAPNRSPALSVNPPVSGTVYQNTNAFDIRLKIPITYSPTSSAAATLATGISNTSTVTTTTKVSIPAGAVTGAIYTYDMVVPLGWYFEIVVTNATIGTVEVEAA